MARTISQSARLELEPGPTPPSFESTLKLEGLGRVPLELKPSVTVDLYINVT